MVFMEYDYQDQDRNWRGSSPASADNNGDKKIITNFLTLGYQHMFNRRWGVMGELPLASRYFKVADEDTGDIMEFTHSGLGDIRLKGIYTGFSDDMSSGLTFGLKFPTGSYNYEHFDPDIQIGSGSTDILLGAYHLGQLAEGSAWYYFANTEADLPVIHYSGYTPGSEVDAAAGVYFSRWKIGPIKIAPLAQVVGTHRWSDSGVQALSEDTGFSRVLIAPGVEFGTSQIRVYTDIGLRIYQYTTGNQLISSRLFKLNVSYHF